jgi:hypothetical protein
MTVLMPELELLVALVGRPSNPSGSGADWTGVEERLSLEFPAEFKQLVHVFGTGPWAGFLHVLSPFATNELLLERCALRSLGALHEIRRTRPDDVPYALYPESLGLFPWAITDNGDTICWLTEGFNWPTVIFPPRDPTFEVHRLSPASLIAEFLNGTLQSPCLIEPFEGDAPVTRHHW